MHLRQRRPECSLGSPLSTGFNPQEADVSDQSLSALLVTSGGMRMPPAWDDSHTVLSWSSEVKNTVYPFNAPKTQLLSVCRDPLGLPL